MFKTSIKNLEYMVFKETRWDWITGRTNRLHMTNYFFQRRKTDKLKLVKNSRACDRDEGGIGGIMKVAPDTGEEAQKQLSSAWVSLQLI